MTTKGVYFLSLLMLPLLGFSQVQLKSDNNDLLNFVDKHLAQFHQPLSAIDSVAGFRSKENPIKLYGTVYNNDGTPAAGVTLMISQADENGQFELIGEKGDRLVYHNAAVTTDSNGQYEIYTFIPGYDRQYNQMQQVYPVIVDSDGHISEMASVLFEGDPLLTKRCRRRLAKANQLDRITNPKYNKETKLLEVQKNIVLEETESDS